MSNENQENSGEEELHSPITNMLLTRQNRFERLDLNRVNSRVSSQHRAPLGDITSVSNVISENNSTYGPKTDKPRTIVIEGNIGSGKSTLLKYFDQKKGIEVFPEPVRKWQDVRGTNMLDLLYQDPSRWSFAFQSYVQFTMLQVHQAPTSRRVKMMERSLHSCKYCFIENLYQTRRLQRPEYNVLSEWFDWLQTTKDLHIDHIVYLRSTPEQCEKRIIARSRKEESGIPLDYLRELHQMHEDWLFRRTKFELPAPVLVLDATKPLDDMVEQFTLLEEKLHLQNL
ncbi:deoxynucleoside kinase-like [Acanthaster planci]|uniref:Deoxynucleoside kinase-like n=1 Tax=Acanthaster planci TaxID=133434 RepID=A0A8B7YMR9_ACAPL|nr:deoxynucleoside kinase-like [Acanthaster planci]